MTGKEAEMDPDACFDALTKAVLEGNWDEAREHADDLATWDRRGGYPPSAPSGTWRALIKAVLMIPEGVQG